MLPLDKISHVAVHEKDWHNVRRGKITASQFHRLVGSNSHDGTFTKGAITYLEELAYETITGENYKDEIFNDNINYGNALEIEAIQHFSAKTGLAMLRDTDSWNTHRLILHDDVFACTPDALIPVNPAKLFNREETAINVRTLEVKCNRKKFVTFYKCVTPKDLLKAESAYYYQVITQMEFCGAAVGYWACYNPSFPNPMRVIEFKKADMMDEFTKFNATCHHAKIELIKTIELLKAA